MSCLTLLDTLNFPEGVPIKHDSTDSKTSTQALNSVAYSTLDNNLLLFSRKTFRGRQVVTNQKLKVTSTTKIPKKSKKIKKGKIKKKKKIQKKQPKKSKKEVKHVSSKSLLTFEMYTKMLNE